MDIQKDELTLLSETLMRYPENVDVFQRIVDLLRAYVSTEFARRLLDKIAIECRTVKDHNTCPMRYPDGFNHPTSFFRAFQETVQALAEQEGFSTAYDLLKDSNSRDMMVQVIAYRILGGRYVKLSTNSPHYWHQFDKSNTYVMSRDVIPTGFSLGSHELKLDLCSWQFNNDRLMAYCKPASILFAFMLEQYAYRKGYSQVSVREGDYVIDGGGCWGDSALYFASLAGPKGKVFSFEFLPFNISMMHKNACLNSDFAEQIEVIPNALWDRTGEHVPFNENGPGSSIDQQHQSSKTATTMAIDDFVKEKKLPKVDFIKMDIEGAELNALRGAEATLKKFKPRLAICVYHKRDDMITIPRYLNSLGIGYDLYMNHYSIHSEETVLFAV
jgi:FkbM family methyltransferase